TPPSSSPDGTADSPVPLGIDPKSRSDPTAPLPSSGRIAPNHPCPQSPLASAETSSPVLDSTLETSFPCPAFKPRSLPYRVHYVDMLLKEGWPSRSSKCNATLDSARPGRSE